LSTLQNCLHAETYQLLLGTSLYAWLTFAMTHEFSDWQPRTSAKFPRRGF